MKVGQWEIEIRDYQGWQLMAPTSFWNASEEEREEKTGGCGPGTIGDWLVPDTAYGESFTLMCEIHDFMYAEGLTQEEKQFADRCMQYNGNVLIQNAPFTGEVEDQALDVARVYRVTTYYLAVFYKGGSSFSKGETPTKEDISLAEYGIPSEDGPG